MAVMGSEGDMKIVWDPSVPAEVDHARTSFDHFRSIGYAAARMNPNGSTGEVIREFDPSLSQILFYPPMQGG